MSDGGVKTKSREKGLGRDLGSVCSQLQVSPFWSRHRELPQERMEMFQDGEEAWPVLPWLFGPKSAQRKPLLIDQQVALVPPFTFTLCALSGICLPGSKCDENRAGGCTVELCHCLCVGRAFPCETKVHFREESCFFHKLTL